MSGPIERGSPKSRSGRKLSEFGKALRELAEEAGKHPGHWFSIPMDDKHTPLATQTMARNALSYVVADISVSDGRVYMKINLP